MLKCTYFSEFRCAINVVLESKVHFGSACQYPCVPMEHFPTFSVNGGFWVTLIPT